MTKFFLFQARNNQHQRLMVEFTMKLVRAYEFLMLCGVDVRFSKIYF